MSAAGVGVNDAPLDQGSATIGGEDDFGFLKIVLIFIEMPDQVRMDGFPVYGASCDVAATEVVPEAFRDGDLLAIPEEAEALDDAVFRPQPARQAFAAE